MSNNNHITFPDPDSITLVEDSKVGNYSVSITKSLIPDIVFNLNNYDFSATFWINIRSYTMYHYMFWCQDIINSGDNWFGFTFDNAGELKWHSYNGTHTHVLISNAYTLNEWVHYTWIYTSDGSILIYKDGVEIVNEPQFRIINVDFRATFNITEGNSFYIDDLRKNVKK